MELKESRSQQRWKHEKDDFSSFVNRYLCIEVRTPVAWPQTVRVHSGRCVLVDSDGGLEVKRTSCRLDATSRLACARCHARKFM